VPASESGNDSESVVIKEMDVKEYPLQITSHDIEMVLALLLPGDLFKHAVSEGRKAARKAIPSSGGVDDAEPNAPVIMNRLRRNADDGMDEPLISRDAGLQFIIAPIHNFLLHRMMFNVHPLLSVFLGGVLEYLAAEVLELGGNVARSDKRSRLQLSHILRAIETDEELRSLFLPYSTILGNGFGGGSGGDGDWSWRPRVQLGGLSSAIQPIQPLSYYNKSLNAAATSSSGRDVIQRPFGWPHYIRLSLVEHGNTHLSSILGLVLHVATYTVVYYSVSIIGLFINVWQCLISD
jgi:hypothetical protein